MSPKALLILGVVVLTACETKPSPQTTYREILDTYKTLNMRVNDRAAPILLSGAEFCQDTKFDNGIVWHELADYPQTLQPVAEHYWDVGDQPSVFFVRRDSPAAKAGIKAKDQPDEDILAQLERDNPGVVSCDYPVMIRYSKRINAFANGEAIIITSGMVEAVEDDLYLSLVIAHELSHNILRHIDQASSQSLEDDADRGGLILLARAGMDLEKAVKARTKTRLALSGSAELSDDERIRIAKFGDVARDIQAQIRAGVSPSINP